MRVTVEMRKHDDEVCRFTIFDDVKEIYVETFEGLKMQQDKVLSGYRITEEEENADDRE